MRLEKELVHSSLGLKQGIKVPDNIWGKNKTQFFFSLTPDMILSEIETLGIKTTGRVLTLNSMENRVYEVECELNGVDSFVVAKFYRPGRWSREQIQEEHSFLLELRENEIPVIAPLAFSGETVFRTKDGLLNFCLFPKMGGRAPDEMSDEKLEILGRLIARVHLVGSQKKALHRLSLTPETFLKSNLDYLLSHNIVPLHHKPRYESLTAELGELVAPLFSDISVQRIHGDCHLGNIMHRESEGFYLLDFDDMLVGPKIQDLWLIVPGRDQEEKQRFHILLDAYREFGDISQNELRLIEPLRTFRYIHFTAWMSKRWDDPAFKLAFPHFGGEQYWETSVRDLEDQVMIIKQVAHNLIGF